MAARNRQGSKAFQKQGRRGKYTCRQAGMGLKARRQRLRRDVYRILESPTGGGWVRRWIDASLILLILVNAGLVLVEEALAPGAHAAERSKFQP